jgi:hypothetical protein
VRDDAPQPVAIIECHAKPTHAFQVWSLETGETAVVLTTVLPIAASHRWSWKLGRVIHRDRKLHPRP